MPEKPQYEPMPTAGDDASLDDLLQAREGVASESPADSDAVRLKALLPNVPASTANAVALALRRSGSFDSFADAVSDPVR
jgi:hypothetical protein